MASKISYQTWDGGEGWNCPRILIGYCVESPLEVLKQVLLTHDVYHYQDLYRPIDYNYPNNVTGLIIDEVKAPKGTSITGYFKDLNCDRALTKHDRGKESILDSLDKCRKWHTYPTNKKVQNIDWKLIDEIINVVNEKL